MFAAAMIVIAFAAAWRLSWWEWHVLMLIAFDHDRFAAGLEELPDSWESDRGASS